MFTVHLKKDIGNDIGAIVNKPIRSFTVDTLVISDGLIWKNNYAIPVQSILFIQED